MSTETIKLKVPADAREGYPEFVSHGNRHAELVPGSTVETEDRKFADWLVATYGLVEVGSQQSADQPDENTPDAIDPDLYPADFPSRDVLISHNVAYETAIKLDADQLKAYTGIGPKTAEQILAFVENGGTE